MARPGLFSLGGPEGFRDRFRDCICLVQPCIPLRDRRKNPYHVHVLVVLLVKVLQGRLPGQCYKRCPVHVSICNARSEVCRPGSQSRRTDPRPTGQPPVDSGHESGGLLMTDRDEFDFRGSSEGIGEREDLFARHLEDEFYLLILKPLYKQFGPFHRTELLSLVGQSSAYLEQLSKVLDYQISASRVLTPLSWEPNYAKAFAKSGWHVI